MTAWGIAILTAFQYGTEQHVEQAIRESILPREELFITSKLYLAPKLLIQEILELIVSVTDSDGIFTWLKPADIEEALDRSLKALGTDHSKHGL